MTDDARRELNKLLELETRHDELIAPGSMKLDRRITAGAGRLYRAARRAAGGPAGCRRCAA